MKKPLLILSLVVFLTFTAASLVNAQQSGDTPSNISIQEAGEARRDYDENGSVSVEGTTVPVVTQANLAAFSCLLGETRACTDNPQQQGAHFQQSVMGKVTEGITLAYLNPPANTKTYLADLGTRAGIVKPAYAQGIGFAGLSPIIGIWRAFRNIAYGFLIVVLMVVGFMVMFRMKIDPRTVVSIQSALPRIVVTLILITFSYAIVGLLIDFMYILIFLFMGAMRATGLAGNISPDIISYYTGGPLSYIYGAMYSSGQAGVDSIVAMIGLTNIDAITRIIGGVAGALIGAQLDPLRIFGGAIGAVTGAVAVSPNSLVSVLVWIAIVFAFLRILIMLITSYIQIILSLLLGPLQLMLGALPNTDAFGSWIRNLIANIAVFPLTSALLVLSSLLTAAAYKNPNLWVAPGIGTTQGAGASGIIGLAMALTIPTIVNSIKEALKAKPPIQAGLTPIMQPVGMIAGGVSQLSTLAYQWKFIRGK